VLFIYYFLGKMKFEMLKWCVTGILVLTFLGGYMLGSLQERKEGGDK
jgi:hypothetical protein